MSTIRSRKTKKSVSSGVPPSRFRQLIARFKEKRILVVGDLMLDQFIWGQATHISPEAPIPVVKVAEESYMPGGAANVVNNICSLGGRASIIGVIGTDHSGRSLRELLEREGADTSLIVASRNEHTIVKTRVIAQHQHIVRFDRDMKLVGDGRIRNKLIKKISQSIDSVDAIILEDYGKGVLTQPFVDCILKLAGDRKKIVTADPKIDNWLDFSGATLITPNFAEASA